MSEGGGGGLIETNDFLKMLLEGEGGLIRKERDCLEYF